MRADEQFTDEKAFLIAQSECLFLSGLPYVPKSDSAESYYHVDRHVGTQ